jgi:type II secretory pathway component PulK
VTFVVALASIVVTDLAYSTYLAARANSVIEKSLFAEYLMKSAANIGSAYLLADKDPQADGPQDLWARFQKGQVVPLQMLGINEPNASLSVELISEKQKFPIKTILPSGLPSSSTRTMNRDRLSRLFEQLGFDNDLEEKETTGKLKGRFFNSKQLVANFIDSISSDTDSYSAPPYQGIKSDLPPQFFPNKVPESIGQLRTIPGFTANRMRKIQPLISLYGAEININFAPLPILKALSSQMTSNDIAKIITEREAESGPIRDFSQLRSIIPTSVLNDLNNDNIIKYDSYSGPSGGRSDVAYFQVISKVELGVKTYFMRAILDRDMVNKEVVYRELQFY